MERVIVLHKQTLHAFDVIQNTVL